MDAQDLVSGIRWQLLQHIAKEPSTGADLARAFGTSAANVTQHLKLLELGGLVVKERINGKSMHYKIPADTALVTILANPPQRMTVPLHGLDALYLKLLCDHRSYAKYLRQFIARYETVVEGFVSMALLNYDHDIQLLVIATDVKLLRKDYANIHVGDKKIIIWSHTPAEFQEGLQRHEPYFMEKVRQAIILYDPDGYLTHIQEEHRE